MKSHFLFLSGKTAYFYIRRPDIKENYSKSKSNLASLVQFSQSDMNNYDFIKNTLQIFMSKTKKRDTKMPERLTY